MALDRKTQRDAAPQRQPPPPSRTVAPSPSPTRAMQQRLGNQASQSLLNRPTEVTKTTAATSPPLITITSEAVDISSGVFAPSGKVANEIASLGHKGLETRIISKHLAGEGKLKMRVGEKGRFDSISRGSMPLVNPWMEQLGLVYVNFGVKEGHVKGQASLSKSDDAAAWLRTLKTKADLIAPGVKIGKLPDNITNRFEDGNLELGVNELHIEVGGFLDATASVIVENSAKPAFDATAHLDIKGMVKGEFVLDNKQGALAGHADLAIDYKSFSGSATVTLLPDGTIDIQGKGKYDSDKLSGEVNFVATDLETANRFSAAAIAAAGGLKNVQDAAPPAPVPLPNEKSKKRALAATGQLNFNLTKWFAGTVHVVVDGQGHVTVIGKIAPPGEIPLFPQKDWDKELVKFEVTASYGIPHLASLDVFANIALHAIAKLGPAKLYLIEIIGTYSTDPKIQKEIQISGAVNISAYAGLKLKVEGGAGVTLLRHHLKFGVGIDVDVGVKAYAEARPTIGFRDPGEFYIGGTIEMVAQPMLGLGGEFFIELDTPWWSPLSDHRWAWPLFSKEWPLTDPIGINAVVHEYVLGSGNVPEIELQPPKFDPSKFMTSLVDDDLPSKSGGQGAGKGTFKDDGTIPKPVVPPKKAPPTKKLEKPGKKALLPSKGKAGKPGAASAADQAGIQSLEAGLNALKNKQPYSKPELDKALAPLKNKVKGSSFTARLAGDKWIVTPTVPGKKKAQGQVELTAMKGGSTSAESEKGLAALDQITKSFGKGATLEELNSTIRPIKTRFNFKSLTLEQKDGFWVFHYEFSTKGERKGPRTVGGSHDEQADVKSLAADLIGSKLGAEASVDEAVQAAKSVLSELKQKGLVALGVIENPKGGYLIEAEASPIADLFRLLPNRGRGFAVRLAAKVFLKGDQPATQGTTKHDEFRPKSIYDRRRRDNETVVDTYDAAMVVLPVNEQHRSTAHLVKPKDNDTLFDHTFTGDTDLQSIEFVAGNTGESMYMSNSSHAEEQFADWYKNQPDQWRSRVVRIEVFVSHSPCGGIHRTCTAALARILEPAISPSHVTGVLRWGKVWVDERNPAPANTSTTAQDVVALESGGWRVSGPGIKGVEEARRKQQLRVEREKGPTVFSRSGGVKTGITPEKK